MNPLIPSEFYSNSDDGSDNIIDTSVEESGEVYPPMPSGGYGLLKILPLQVFIIQRLLEHPDLVVSRDLPPALQEFFLSVFMATGRLSATNLRALGPAAVCLDLSWTPTFHDGWLAPLAQSPTLTELHLLHVPNLSAAALSHLVYCENLTDLSIGPDFNFEQGNVVPLEPIFNRLRIFRLNTHHASFCVAEWLLSQLSSDLLEHLEITLEDPIPWKALSNYTGLKILRLMRSGQDLAETEIHTIQDNLLRYTQLQSLHLSFAHDFAPWLNSHMHDLQRTWPSLTHVLLTGTPRPTEREKEVMAQYVTVLKSELDWAEHGISKIFRNEGVLSALGQTDDLSDAHLSLLLTEARYGMYRAETIQLLSVLLHSAIEDIEAVFGHPMFVPLVAQMLRINTTSEPVWVALVSVLDHYLSDVSEGDYEEEIMEKAVLQFYWEDLRGILEKAILDNPVDFENDETGIPTPVKPIHECIMRMIGIFAPHTPSGHYPARMCLSSSAVIVGYVCKPWHRKFAQCTEYEYFLRKIKNLPENIAFCQQLHDLGFAHRIVNEVLDKWAPMAQPGVKYTDYDSRSAPDVSPIPDILSTVLPKHLAVLFEHHIDFVLKVLRLMPFSQSTGWAVPIHTWASFHGAFTATQESEFCRNLTYVMQSYRISFGYITGHLIVFLSSFCKHCRRNLVESRLGPEKQLRNAFVPNNAIDYMAHKQQQEPYIYMKPVAGWVLERKQTFEKWIQLLQEQIILPAGLTPLGVLNHLTETMWNGVVLYTDRATPFAQHAWEQLAVWEALAIFSQSVPVCRYLIEIARGPSVFEWLTNMTLVVGAPANILSILYHVSFAFDDFPQRLAHHDVRVERKAHGGRRIDATTELPYRLLQPLVQNGQNEDLLSLLSETLLAGILSFPAGTQVITLRILCAFSCLHQGLHVRLQETKHAARILSQALATAEDEGGVLGPLMLACDLYADLPAAARLLLPAPIRQGLRKEYLMQIWHQKSGHPWWESCQCFLIRSLFRRGLHLILNPTRSLDPSNTRTVLDSANTSLDQQEIADLNIILDVVVRLAVMEDISTREVAFHALYYALTCPSSSNSLLSESILLQVQRVVVIALSTRHAQVLKEHAEFEYFGFTSRAVEVYDLMKSLLLQQESGQSNSQTAVLVQELSLAI